MTHREYKEASGAKDPRPPHPLANPFSARHLRPGEIPYIFVDGQSAASLIDRLHDHGDWGEIVGPHGTGKSTLLRTLVDSLEKQGRRVQLVNVEPGRSAPRLPSARRLPRGGVLAVDGFDQLSPWRMRWWRQLCRWRGWGLVVTTHAPLGLPVAYRTTMDSTVARQVIAQLSSEAASGLSDEALAALVARHRGNLRESLFELYDQWEQAHRQRA